MESLNNTPTFLSYFDPYSFDHKGSEDFRHLSLSMQALTVVATTFAVLLSLPIFGLGGLALFRYLSRRYSVINPNVSSNNSIHSTAIKTHNLVISHTNKLTKDEWNEILKGFDGVKLSSQSLAEAQKATYLSWDLIQEARKWNAADLENLIQLCSNLQEIDLKGYFQFAATHFSKDGLNPEMKPLEIILSKHPTIRLIWWGKTSSGCLGTRLWMLNYFNSEFFSMMVGKSVSNNFQQYLSRLAEFPCNLEDYLDDNNGVEFAVGIARVLDFMLQLRIFDLEKQMKSSYNFKTFKSSKTADILISKLLQLKHLQKLELPPDLKKHFLHQLAKNLPNLTKENQRYLDLATHYDSEDWPPSTDHSAMLKLFKNLQTLNFRSMKKLDWTLHLANQIKGMKGIDQLELPSESFSDAKENVLKGNPLSPLDLITLEIVQNINLTSVNNPQQALKILKLTPNVRNITMIKYDLDEDVANAVDSLKHLISIKFDGGTVRFSDWDKPYPDNFREAVYSGKTDTALFRVARLALSGDIDFNNDFTINDKDLIHQQQMIEALKDVKGKKCLRFSELTSDLLNPAPWIDLCKTKGWELDPLPLDGKNASIQNLSKLEATCLHTLILKDAKYLDKEAVDKILNSLKPTNVWFQGELPQWDVEVWNKFQQDYNFYNKGNSKHWNAFFSNPFGTFRLARKKDCRNSVSRNGYIGKTFDR